MNLTISLAVALFAALVSGCVTHTTIKDAPRQSVSFSSPQAAQSFYDAYLSASSPKGHGSVVVYVPLPYSHRTVRTDNVRFNAAVGAADTDHDGVISDDEASAYAAKFQCSVTPIGAVALNVNP